MSVLIINVAVLDATAQGMTTLTIVMKKRLVIKRNPLLTYRSRSSMDLLGNEIATNPQKSQPSFIKSYGEYLIANYGAVFLYVSFAYIVLFYEERHASNSSETRSQADKMQDLFNRITTCLKICTQLCLLSSILLLCICLGFRELKKTSWYQPPSSFSDLRKALWRIFGNIDSLMILSVLLLTINPSNYLQHIVIAYFGLYCPQTNHLSEYHLVIPILVAGLLAVTTLFIFKTYGSKLFVRYIMVVTLAQLINYFGLTLLATTDDDNYSSGVHSHVSMFFLLIAVFYSCDGTSSIMKLLLVDKFLRDNPTGYEVFFVNLLSSMVSTGRALGKVILAGMNGIERIQPERPSTMAFTLYYDWIFIILSLICYFTYFVITSRREQAGQMGKTEPLGNSSLGEWNVIDNLESSDGDIGYQGPS